MKTKHSTTKVVSAEKETSHGDYARLAAGFTEDDEIEGVFLIKAASKDTFFNRKSKLNAVTGFSDGYFDSYEEDDEGGIWKVITTASFDTVAELKAAIEKMRKYNWFFYHDSYLMLDSNYLFSDGKWLV